MRTRLKDVAQKAGVAINTASTILNRRSNSGASKETAARVFKAAEDLGYQPSRAAVALRMGKFNAIGLIVPDLQNPFYANLAETLETEIARHGYDLVLESSRANVQRETDHLRSIMDRQVDGMVCILIDHERNYSTLQEYHRRGKAVVAMHERGVGGVPVDAVTVDFHAGTTQAVQYLVGLGHRTIAFLLAVCPGQQEGDRPEVFRKLVQECGFGPGDVSFVRCDHTIASARAATSALLRRPGVGRPTAILAHNDLAAIGVIRGALDLGLKVPGDLSVVGVDHTPIGQHLTTALTTVEQPVQRMVAAAVELLLRRMEDPRYAEAQEHAFSTRLVLGESTAPPSPRPQIPGEGDRKTAVL